ncbi:MAG TPA: TIGR00297 family protein [Euryarchaeota archaeon]|nr:MAG: TIGR00297 family protein [Thermococci archaeon]HEC95878.1 TIGR00297 family protein [Euryarchaeota archaeon]
MIDPIHIIIAFAICSVIGLPSYKMNVVDFSGLLSGYIVGMGVILFTDLKWFVLIFMFFFLSGAATKYKYDQKKKKGVAQGKKGARGYLNVFGNGLVALSFAVFEGVIGGEVFLAGYLAAIASATSDTAGGEIGRLSKHKPRLITNFKEVPTGSEGAISILGETAEFLIALFIGVLAFGMGMDHGTNAIIVATLGGFIGANIDSVLGATVETNVQWWGNNWTNFISTLLGAIAGVGIYYLL